MEFLNDSNSIMSKINTENKECCLLGDLNIIIISTDNSAQKDIKARLNKARFTFSRLKNIWKSKQYNLKTKVRIYNSNVKSVLLYGAECWRIVKIDMNKLSAFHNSCLRKICNIYWPNKITNDNLYQKTGCTSIDVEIKKRRLRWLGHVLRMSHDRIPKVASRWTPPGKRKRGRPKTTWRRTVEMELKELGLTWGQAQALAKDKTRPIRDIVAAPCPTGGSRV